jgi:hypothetical protein
VERQKAERRKLRVKVENARAQWVRLLGEDDDAADAALRGAKQVEDEAAHLDEVIASGESRLSEWPTAPEIDVALDSYIALQDAIHGRLSGSQTLSDLRAHLRGALAEARLHVKGGWLHGTFKLRVTDHVVAGKLPQEVVLYDHNHGTTYSKHFAPEPGEDPDQAIIEMATTKRPEVTDTTF